MSDETLNDALVAEATAPIPSDQWLLGKRRALVQELRRETDKYGRAILQHEINEVDRELDARSKKAGAK